MVFVARVLPARLALRDGLACRDDVVAYLTDSNVTPGAYRLLADNSLAESLPTKALAELVEDLIVRQ